MSSTGSSLESNVEPEKTGDSLKAMFRLRPARSLMSKLMLQRVAVAGFGTAITTLIAIQPTIQWLPYTESKGLSGLAVLGIVSAAGALGSLLSNGIGQKWVENHGPLYILKISAIVQILFSIALAAVLIAGNIQDLGIVGLSILSFCLTLTTPGISGLARAWWEVIGLSKTLAARGGALEPSLAAIAWSVGPVIAAPLVLLTPWVLVIFSLSTALGLFLLAGLPNPYIEQPVAINSTKKISVKEKVSKDFRNWWMAGTYSFYHMARALLNLGSSSILVGANQQALIGAASAAPSIGHSVAGVFFAARKNPTEGLRKAVVIGLIGQAIPTALIALVFILYPAPGLIASIVLLIGGGIIIGILKAPVASAIYPLAVSVRPQISTGRSASMLTQGMIVGGLAGPLLGTLIITTVGAVWLLPASVVTLIICGAGVMTDEKMLKTKIVEEAE
jgi:MFS family permease